VTLQTETSYWLEGGKVYHVLDILTGENMEVVKQSLILDGRLPKATVGVLVVPLLPSAINSFGRNTASTLGVCNIKMLLVSMI
jgi:hypothetical protein